MDQNIIFCAALFIVPAILGAILGRVFPRARMLAARGTPISLLLGPACMLLSIPLGFQGIPAYLECWMGNAALFYPFLPDFLYNESSALILLLATFGAVLFGAVFCAFSPNRVGFGIAALGAELWMAFFAVILLSGSMGPLIPVLQAAISVVSITLSFMGLFLKPDVPNETVPEPVKLEITFSESQAAKGSITLLVPPFAGQCIPLSANEELVLGSDATRCHLILEQPGFPPCFCSIRWLGNRNTYLISTHDPNGLLWSTGTRAPYGSVMEVFPKTICYLPVTGQPVLQVG